MALLLLVSQAAHADEPTVDPEAPTTPAQTSLSANPLDLEVGVHWVDNFGTYAALARAQRNAYDFYNFLRFHTLTRFGIPRWCTFAGHSCFIFGGANAWEDDYVDNNDRVVDAVDVTYFQGSGGPGYFNMRPPDDARMVWYEVKEKWGNFDWEWAFFNVSNMMPSYARVSWYGVMNGLHGLAGFTNTAYDTAGFGKSLAVYLVLGYRFRDAWFKTCDTKQPSGVRAQIIVEDKAFFQETAYTLGADKPRDGKFAYWVKACGAPTSATVTAQQLGNVFPVYKTPDLTPAEQESNFTHLSSAFGFSGQRASDARMLELDGARIITDTQGRELEVDLDTGLFYYYDPARTYGALPATGAASTDAVLSPTDAKLVADQFLRDNGLWVADAVFNSVANVVIGEETESGGANAGQTNETVVAYEVIYSRYVTTTVASGEVGATAVVQIPVDGPGAKLKVYVDPYATANARVARDGLPGAVIGAQGGWRRVDRSARVQAQVALLDYETQILPLFNNEELEPLVTYTTVPFPDGSPKTVISHTIVGWEEGSEESQDVLYPVHRLDVEYTDVLDQGGGVTSTVTLTGSAWIAANPRYMRPLARIEATSPTDVNYAAGSRVTATATDATRTLIDLGYTMPGSNLDFALGSGSYYTYEWFLGDVEQGRKIGSGRDLDYVLKSGDIHGLKSSPGGLLFTLLVTDTGSGHTSLHTSTASFTLQAVEPIYLPIVRR